MQYTLIHSFEKCQIQYTKNFLYPVGSHQSLLLHQVVTNLVWQESPRTLLHPYKLVHFEQQNYITINHKYRYIYTTIILKEF